MHIYVKLFKGNDFEVAVSAGQTVQGLKEILAMQISIPVEEQKLVFKGKALADDKLLSFYKIEEGDRVFLFTKKVDKPTAAAAAENIPKFAADMSCCSTTVLWDKLRIFLQRHFTPQDVEKVLIEFQKDFNSRLQRLSLDDIERLAITKLRQTNQTNGVAGVS
ncbi:ubiquitin-like protein 4A [Crassostrea virginica]|uniref:Ubiquitin-like protein 4A n=1 Tax=Crassostrea virginica TaxID=6565 RepID=A0A8B8BEC8_CRAVI|nr:ubiquitin-like protein 4A [Crassostrea virginica]